MSDDLQTAAEIVRDLFDEYKGPVTRELCARDVEQWDSLMTVQLAVLFEPLLRHDTAAGTDQQRNRKIIALDGLDGALGQQRQLHGCR